MRWPPALLLAAWGAGLAGSAGAQECRLALVLALDVSSSVDESEDRLQREGLARALLAAPVRRAFLAGDPVALFAFEWSGEHAQAPILPGWKLIRNEGELEAAAQAILKSQRSRTNLPTAVGAALGHAATRLRDAPDCRAKTIDLTGDGVHNDGFGPALAYENFPLDDVTVNALIIGGAGGEDAYLVAWFQDEVLHGPGSFSIYTRGYVDYERAMEAKLLKELELPVVGGVPAGGNAG
jgi:hypothetical protein